MKKYRQFYRDDYLKKLIDNVESPFSDVRPLLKDEDAILKAFDAYRWLRAITKDKQVFRDELGPVSKRFNRGFNQKNAFNFVFELLDARNAWAHSNARDQVSNDGLYRIAENATRLLAAVNAQTNALVAKEMMREIGRRIYGECYGGTETHLQTKEKDLDTTKQELASTTAELASKNKRLTSVEHELRITKLDLESARISLETTKVDLAETSQRLNSVERELTDANRNLKSLEEEHADGRYGRGGSGQAAEGDKERDHSASEIRVEVSSRGKTTSPADFTNHNLPGKDYTGQNLALAKLMNADLSGAILREVDLTQANLQRANLSKADMTRANMRGADLTGADLRNATLKSADFTGAILLHARLSGALDRSTILPDGTNWTPNRVMNDFLR